MCLSPPWLKLYLAEQKILKKMQLKLSEQIKWCLKPKASYIETILLCLISQTTGWEGNSFRWDQWYLKHRQHICLLSLLTNICQDRAFRRSLGNPVYCLTVCPAWKVFWLCNPSLTLVNWAILLVLPCLNTEKKLFFSSLQYTLNC